MARRSRGNPRGAMDEIDWMSALKSTAGGVAGGLGGTLVGILGVPIGLGGHVATEYFAERQGDTMDVVGKGVSNGFIAGGMAMAVGTMGTQNLQSQLGLNKDITFENMLETTGLTASLMAPSLYINEQLTGLFGEVEDWQVNDRFLTKKDIEELLKEYAESGVGFLE